MEKKTSPGLVALMVVSMIVWGGTWPSAKLIAGKAAPEVLVFWRFLITAAAFAPVMFFSRSPLRVPKEGLAATAAAGLCLSLYNWLFFAGLRLGLAGAGGVIVPALSPVFTFLFLLVFRRQRPRLLETAGLALGFAGGALFLQFWSLSPREIALSGNLLFLAAAAVWSAVTLAGQAAQRKVPFVTFSFLSYAVAAILDLPMALIGGITSVFLGGALVWWNLLYLSVLATAFATSVYFIASSRLGSGRASSFMFVVPTAALALSWAVLGEAPAPATLAGGGLAVAAVYLINGVAPGRGSGYIRPDDKK
jgi:drug/metabolite transporter (DMT)-like permease